MSISVCFYMLATCFQWKIVPMLAVNTEVLEDNILYQARIPLWGTCVFLISYVYFSYIGNKQSLGGVVFDICIRIS